MNKLYLITSGLLVAVAPMLNRTNAQVVVNIGNGTLTGTSTESIITPYGTYWHDDRTQYIFTASEIIAAGGFAGSITAMGVQMGGAGGQTLNLTVQIGTTTQTDLSTGFVQSGLTTVYTNTNYTPVSSGFDMITFNTPFTWNGTSNIVVDYCNNNSTYTTSWPVVYQNLSTSMTRSLYGDLGSGTYCGVAGGSTSVGRPNFRFHFLPPVSNDAGIAAITSPELPSCDLDSLNISILLQNMGNATLTSCTIKYQIGSGSIVTTPWTGSVSSLGGTTAVTLGVANFTNGQQLHIWTEMPNGVQDSLPANDNAYLTVATGLSGTYSIPGDYANLQAAANALAQYGVCDHVVFNIAAGTYTEQAVFNQTPGTSEDATVTFRSAAGNLSAVRIQNTATTLATNYVIRLNGADWYRFEDLTFLSTGTGGFGVVFAMINGAHNNIIEDCWLKSHVFTTTTVGDANSTVFINGINNGNILRRNRIEKGNSLVYAVGSSAAAPIQGLVIENNIIEDMQYYGVFMNFVRDLVFTGNNVKNDSAGYSGAYVYYPFYLQNVNRFQIDQNYFNFHLVPSGYCVYLINCVGGNNPRSSFSNNCVVNSPATSSYGYYSVFFTGSGNANIYNNSIIHRGAAGSYTGLYLTNGGGIRLYNNTISNHSGGYALFASGGFTLVESDYNNLFSTGASPIYWNTSAFSNLAAYNAASGFDPNSMAVDPAYQNFPGCITCSEHLDGAGTPAITNLVDISASQRSVNTPDIGAVEYVTGSSFTMGPDTTMCASEYLVEAGPAQLVLWNVGGNITTGQTYLLSNTSGTPQEYTVMVNINTLFCGSGSDTVVIRLVPNADLGSDQHLCASDQTTLSAGGGTSATYQWSTGETTASIVTDAAGTYLVTKNEEGCESTDEIVITKSTAVEIADIEACEDDAPITIDATIPDGNSYAWSAGSSLNTAVNTISTSGSYSVTATDNFGCVSSDNFNVLLLGDPVAVITVTNGSGVIRVFDGTNSLQVGSTTQYTWLIEGNTYTGPQVLHNFPWSGEPTSYPVTLDVNNGCETSSTTMNVNIDPLGVASISDKVFALFPNPASDVLYISNPGTAFTAVLMDNAGRVISSESHGATQGIVNLNTTGLATGTYLVKLTSESYTEVHTFVKQ